MVRLVSGSTLLVFAIVSWFSLQSVKHLKTQYSVMQFLPTHHPAMLMDEEVRKKFNLVDRPVFIGVIQKPLTGDSSSADWFNEKDILSLKEITHDLEATAGVQKIISIANVEGASSENNTISVGKVIDVVAGKNLREYILNDHLLSPNLISSDGRTAVIYAVLEDANVDLMAHFLSDFRARLRSKFSTAQTSVGGVPAVQTDLGILLNKELVNFLVLTLVACALTLALIFRTWSSLFITLFLTGFCNLTAFAMMSYAGLSFTVLSATIPILVFIAVVSICVHVMLRTEEEVRAARLTTSSYWQIVLRANRAVAVPNLLGAATTCVGFLTLLTSDVPMIREYGIGVSAAIMLAWFFPRVGVIPLQFMAATPRSREWIRKPARWSLWIIANRRKVTASILATAALALIFGQKLQWTGRLFDELPKAHEARRTTEKIDDFLGGVIPLELTVELAKDSDWNDPGNLSKLDKLLNQIRATTGVGSALSLPDFLRASGVYKDKLPASRGAAAELYALYSFSANNPLTQFLSTDDRVARLQIKIHDLPAYKSLNTVEELKADAQSLFPAAKVAAGGMGAIVHIIQHEISNDLIFGFWQALLIIIVLLTVVFRSLRWSLVAAVPNLLPPILLMAYLVFMKVPIKPSVAIIFSIALGLAFNNTVYALNRLRSLQKTKGELPVYRSFYLEGNPCMLSSLVFLTGFSVFLFSYFELNRVFGQCMLVAILAGMLGDLVLLPALLRLFPQILTFSFRKKPSAQI
jgi:uncharacterized protein